MLYVSGDVTVKQRAGAQEVESAFRERTSVKVLVGQIWECWRRSLGGRRTQSPGEMGD